MGIPGLIALAVLSILLLLFAVLIFSKIRLEVSFEKNNGEKPKTEVTVSFFKGKLKKRLDFSQKTIKAKKKKAKEAHQKEESLSLIEKIKKYHEISEKLSFIWSRSRATVRKNIFAQEFDLSITLGTEDAAVTGIATGSLWALVYTIIGFLSRIIRICVPKVSITPDYDNECFGIRAKCIIEASPANIISIGIRVLISYYFIKKRMKKETKKEKAAINYGNTN